MFNNQVSDVNRHSLTNISIFVKFANSVVNRSVHFHFVLTIYYSLLNSELFCESCNFFLVQKLKTSGTIGFPSTFYVPMC